VIVTQISGRGIWTIVVEATIVVVGLAALATSLHVSGRVRLFSTPRPPSLGASPSSTEGPGWTPQRGETAAGPPQPNVSDSPSRSEDPRKRQPSTEVPVTPRQSPEPPGQQSHETTKVEIGSILYIAAIFLTITAGLTLVTSNLILGVVGSVAIFTNIFTGPWTTQPSKFNWAWIASTLTLVIIIVWSIIFNPEGWGKLYDMWLESMDAGPEPPTSTTTGE
jgi:hypothetical protein